MATIAPARASHPTVGALRVPSLRRYLIGQLPSVTCSWAQVVALSWVVVARDPRALGWVVACQFLPSLALGPWCGAVADRYDRRRLLMLAETGLGVVALGYAALAATDRLTLPWIGVLATVWGCVNALDTPARRALVPMLVPAAHATAAAALAGAVMLTGMTAGSAVGAALVAGVGVPATFAVNAASFAADVAILATLRIGASPRVERAPRQVRDGFAYVRRTPRLREPLVTLAVVATLAFTVQVSVPTLVRASFGGGAAQIGAALTAVAGGSLAGTVVTAIRSVPVRLRTATLSVALASILIAVAPTAAVLVGCLVGLGFAWSLLLMSVIAVLQSAAPAMMGRVMALFAVVLLGGPAVGGPVAAGIAALAGARAPFVLAGMAAAAVAVGVGRHR